MDPLERREDGLAADWIAWERFTSRLWTGFPVIVTEDSDGFTVKCRPTHKYTRVDKDGTVTEKEMPEMQDVPICFTQGGGTKSGDKGYILTMPVKKDDEGLVVISNRCLDGWWENGGIQSLMHTRHHNLSDAMYIPGLRSRPRKLGKIPPSKMQKQQDGSQSQGNSSSTETRPPKASTDTAQLRSDNQHLYVEVSQERAKLVYATDKQGSSEGEKETEPRMVIEVYADKIRGEVLEAGGTVKAYFEMTKDGAFNGKAPQGVTWDAPFIHCTGEITAKTGGDNVSLSTHRHNGVMSGGSNTTKPLSGT